MQLYITNDACQRQIDKHNCYFAYLNIYFDRNTLQWWLSQILEMVFVRYVLFKDEVILETVAIFVQKAGLIWQQGGFSLTWLQYSIHKCDCWLKIVYYSWLLPLTIKPFETKLGKQLDNWTGWKQLGNLLFTLLMSAFLWNWVLNNCLETPWSSTAIKIQQLKLACWEV